MFNSVYTNDGGTKPIHVEVPHGLEYPQTLQRTDKGGFVGPVEPVLLRVRETVNDFLQDDLLWLMQLERELFLKEHGGTKNGSYPRSLTTPYGHVELNVPRDREGNFQTALFPRYARYSLDSSELVIALYAAGVSDRKISDILALLLGHRYSHQTVSQITELVMDRVEAFQNRVLQQQYAFVYIDALFLKVFRPGGGIDTEAVYVALGIAPGPEAKAGSTGPTKPPLSGCGYRQLLGFWLYPTESALVWEELLKGLIQRGVREVLCFVSDPASRTFDLSGVEQAIKRAYPAADWQQCTVHKVRNTLGKVRREDREGVTQALQPVYRAESREESVAAWEAWRRRWASTYPDVVASWQQDLSSLLRFYDYPKELWTYLRSTNLLERFQREIRRGTKVRDHQFPKPESVLKLIYSESERYDPKSPFVGSWEHRRLRGFADAGGALMEMFERRYPLTQKLTHRS